MGNIQMDVVPFRVISRLRSAMEAVKRISRHHPAIPHFMKLLRKGFDL